MRLSPSQIADAARAAGFPEHAIPVAVAIALAESSGETQAHNPTPPDDSYGLWQINMLGAMGPDRRAQFGLSTNAQLFDPVINARAALAISNGGSNWRPWSTFTNGSYRRFLTEGGAASGDSSPGFQLRSGVGRVLRSKQSARTFKHVGRCSEGRLVVVGRGAHCCHCCQRLKDTPQNRLAEAIAAVR